VGHEGIEDKVQTIRSTTEVLDDRDNIEATELSGRRDGASLRLSYTPKENSDAVHAEASGMKCFSSGDMGGDVDFGLW